ncbi:MAG TPA: hypothetical protein VD998_02705 [Verrucomicrobiae bacterium]|nr:hypothetical protein [Verrucomicrobiae bacterium]
MAKLNEVLASKKTFISDQLNLVSVAFALLINIIHWALLFIKIKPGNAAILLHYNVISGPDLVDKSVYAYIVPATALGVLIFNSILSAQLFRREKIASYFLSFMGIPLQLIFLAATVVLIRINE